MHRQSREPHLHRPVPVFVSDGIRKPVQRFRGQVCRQASPRDIPPPAGSGQCVPVALGLQCQRFADHLLPVPSEYHRYGPDDWVHC